MKRLDENVPKWISPSSSCNGGERQGEQVPRAQGETLRSLLCAFALMFAALCSAQSAPSSVSFQTNSAAAFNQLISLDPHSDTNLTQLAQIAGLWSNAKDATKASKPEKKVPRSSDELKSLPVAD